MKTRTKGEPITIRLYPEHEELLQKEAPEGSKTLGPTVERLLVEKLTGDAEIGYLREKALHLEAEVQGIREELKISVEAILLAIVSRPSITPEQAKEWVRKKLRKE